MSYIVSEGLRGIHRGVRPAAVAGGHAVHRLLLEMTTSATDCIGGIAVDDRPAAALWIKIFQLVAPFERGL